MLLTFLTWAPGVVYTHCGQPMEFEALPRAQYVCMVCGATR